MNIRYPIYEGVYRILTQQPGICQGNAVNIPIVDEYVPTFHDTTTFTTQNNFHHSLLLTDI